MSSLSAHHKEQQKVITRANITNAVIFIGWGLMLWLAISTMGSSLTLSLVALLGSVAVSYLMAVNLKRAERRIFREEEKVQGLDVRV